MLIDETAYLDSFPAGAKREKALQYALDTRKFEIELYWKRATYFWTFIAATLAGYGAIQTSTQISTKEYLSVALSCLGVLFSFAWHCVNRGSKQWQENWENHVDMLEDDVIGPLFKTVLSRRPAESRIERLTNILAGPWPLSVSKINQIISIYVVILWLVLLDRSLSPYSIDLSINWDHAILVGGTFFACMSFVVSGKSFKGPHGHSAELRESNIRV